MLMLMSILRSFSLQKGVYHFRVTTSTPVRTGLRSALSPFALPASNAGLDPSPPKQHIPPHYLNLSISLSSPTYEAPRTTPIPAPKAHSLFASNAYLHPRHLQTIRNNIKIVAHQLRIPSLWHESYRARARTRPSIASSRFPTVLDPSLHLGASHSTSASFLTPFLDKRGRPRGASLFSLSTYLDDPRTPFIFLGDH
ncbi:hypothetical protein CcaverHIS631_0111290 [Cutaneotrichosporon cavernicola]|nr:hypothetical protein CcaverHIS631_0111290 [Cutaneotrichosporon cavernicola]